MMTTRGLKRWAIVMTAGLVQALAYGAGPSTGSLSEQDLLADMPIVLSVSRLPQRLDETPGAVTVIDRDFIRLSGARDLADLLRLVPGFQSSMSFEPIAPQASYHGGFATFANRMQVLVDGRSVYSPYFIGSVGPGLMSVALQGIARVEVLRGANSAAYGAGAFLGVINIITRAPLDTLGPQASVAAGNSGVADLQARWGGVVNDSSYRLSLDRRADAGLLGNRGDNLVQRFNARADVPINGQDALEFRAGLMTVGAGRGYLGNVDDPQRQANYHSQHAQLDWRRSLGSDADLLMSFSHMAEEYQDGYDYSLLPLGIPDSIRISISGRSSSDALLLQHSLSLGAGLRAVWGAEFRHEEITSRPLYNTDAAFTTDFARLFGNAEWRISEALILNAGLMLEKHSESGTNSAPRVMLNWRRAPNQTLRFGASRAVRPPSTFEQHSDVRYYWRDRLLRVTIQSTGQVQPETVLAREIGYLAQFPALGLGLDVRFFSETVEGFIRQLNKNPRIPKSYGNDPDFTIKGLEYEAKWVPWTSAQVVFNQALIRNNSVDASIETSVPKLASTLAVFQRVGAYDLSLIHQNRGTMTLQGGAVKTSEFASQRTDLRLGRSFRWGAQRAELAAVVQNLGAPYQDFSNKFKFQQRAFLSLNLEH